MARSAHWRWVSIPRWRRVSAKVTSTAQRIAYHVRISTAVRSGSEQTKARVSARPAGSLVKTHRTGRVIPCEFHNAVPAVRQPAGNQAHARHGLLRHRPVRSLSLGIGPFRGAQKRQEWQAPRAFGEPGFAQQMKRQPAQALDLDEETAA